MDKKEIILMRFKKSEILKILNIKGNQFSRLTQRKYKNCMPKHLVAIGSGNSQIFSFQDLILFYKIYILNINGVLPYKFKKSKFFEFFWHEKLIFSDLIERIELFILSEKEKSIHLEKE